MAPRKSEESKSCILCSIISTGSPQSSVWETDWETESEEERDEEARAEEERKKRSRRIRIRKAGPPVFRNNCHHCRKEIALSVLYVKCSRCPLKFCGACLVRKHGEDVEEEMQENVRWVCPVCRAGCGPGCMVTCCACGPCRKFQQLEPAGRIFPAAVNAGFSNVHDYLVHFETGESAEVIAKRKQGRGWTKATGAIDSSLEFRFTWAMKRMRSRRRRAVPARSDSKRCTDKRLEQAPRVIKLDPVSDQASRAVRLEAILHQPSRIMKLEPVLDQPSQTVKLEPVLDKPSRTVKREPV